QYYFDTDHIGYDEAGEEVSVSNLQPGAGEPWYLADLRKAHLKPMVFQDRTKIKFSALDKSTDEKVFMENEIVYGIDGRYNAAHGFWELAAASKAELNAENYAALRAQMVALRKSNGEPKGVVPNVLIHGPALEGRARKLLINERNDAGASNEWAGTAKPKMAEWLG
ncbi:MAG: hypothetical protein GY862_23710, partial [Gammaproteobacteria bacterium]|nr:hypothetical protein [Gammaproteobacteria bacterium]